MLDNTDAGPVANVNVVLIYGLSQFFVNLGTVAPIYSVRPVVFVAFCYMANPALILCFIYLTTINSKHQFLHVLL